MKATQTPRRKFTDSFKLGQRVRVIRTEHGWHDGSVLGQIVAISDFTCRVVELRAGKQTDTSFDILKPKDISPA